MKKVILACLLSALALFALTGCGNNDAGTGGGASVPNTDVETSAIIGTWDRDDRFPYIALTEWQTFGADGVVDGDFSFEIGYRIAEVEEGIYRLTTYENNPSAEQIEHRDNLTENYLKITFDLSGFGADSDYLIFNESTQEVRGKWLEAERPANDVTIAVEGDLLYGGFAGRVITWVLPAVLERAISVALEQGDSEGEVSTTRLMRFYWTEIDATNDEEFGPQEISFSIEPYTVADFEDFLSTSNYVRFEGNNLREFSSLERARSNNDNALLWAATRR